MSDKIQINNIYIEQLKVHIKKRDSSKLAKIISTLHAADLAEIIEYLSAEQAKYFYKQIKNEQDSAAVLIELEDNTRENLIEDLSAKKIAEKVIDNLATDDAADIIGELSEIKKDQVLSHIEDFQHASGISDLLSYAENTAGSLMEKELIKVNKDWNTLQCLKEMRKQANNIKNVYTIYVVDDKEKLLGLLSLRRLLLTKKKTAIQE